MSQLYYADGRLLGESEIPPTQAIDGEVYRPLSRAFCCPTCGDVWGRIVIPGREWVFVSRPCRKCGDKSSHQAWRLLAGSFLTPPHWLNEYFPDCIVAWEFSSLLTNLERIQSA